MLDIFLKAVWLGFCVWWVVDQFDFWLIAHDAYRDLDIQDSSVKATYKRLRRVEWDWLLVALGATVFAGYAFWGAL